MIETSTIHEALGILNCVGEISHIDCELKEDVGISYESTTEIE